MQSLSPSLGRMLLRRLLPAVIVIPIVLGWLGLWGEKAGWYGANTGVVLMVMTMILSLTVLVCWTASTLKRFDLERSAMEHALRTSEERARLVIESAYDAFIAMDANGIIIDWNRQAENTFGLPGSQAIGRKLSETIIPERYRQQHEAGLKHFFKTGEGPLLRKPVKITALRADGTEFPVELAISPIHWADSWIFNAFLHEITDHRIVDAINATVAPPSGPSDTPPLHILLVEDHENTRTSLARLLEGWGHSVDQAESLAQARELLKSRAIDLLLTDVQLPDGLGSDLMRQLHETSPEAAGIALTGFDSAGFVDQSFQAGFLLHFTKPVATEKLKSAIERVAHVRRESKLPISE
jgi:PAS domain S-box-containing protein